MKRKLQVGVNYLQGDKSRLVKANSEDRLGLSLSTQITDKILLNGNIGVPVGGIETLIVGDLQIVYFKRRREPQRQKYLTKKTNSGIWEMNWATPRLRTVLSSGFLRLLEN